MREVMFPWEGGEVSGAWHDATGASTYLTLAHGAGGNLKTAQLVAIAEELSARGIGVVRFNFPYAERGRRTPGSPKEAVACYRAVADVVKESGSQVVLSGKSYGGRMASHLAADGYECARLVFFGYPLHAPGKTEQLRVEHLARIGVPMLFIGGTRDAFARLDLMERTIASLPTAVMHVIDGADHSFAVPGRSKADVTAELAEAASRWLLSS